MAGVGIIGTIIIGLLAGWLAERFTRSDHGLLTNLILGVVGAVALAGGPANWASFRAAGSPT